VITVNRDDGHVEVFPDATRVSTDESNNLEIWTGVAGDRLAWLCAAGHWIDVMLESEP